jgi:TolA-binding protein
LQRFSRLAGDPITQSGPLAATVSLRRAQLLARQKQWAEARQIVETIAAEHPDFEQRHELDYLLGRCLASEARFDEARAKYRAVVSSNTGGKTETAAMAQWMIGESYFHQQDYEPAIREYLRVEILYAYPNWQAAALLQAAKCHEQLGQWPDAQALYDRLIKDYPTTRYAEEAGRRLQQARKNPPSKSSG